MGLVIEVRSNNSNTTHYVQASLNRRRQSPEHFRDNLEAICNEVAQELKLDFELKQDGNLLFTDKDMQ